MRVGLPLLSSPELGATYSIVIQDDIVPLVLETSNDLNLETGGSIWHGSFALAKYLAQNQHLVKGKTVIEIGAGCGLGGLVASVLGAKYVILTDIPSQIECLEKNVELNRTAIEGEIVCIPLLFGQTDTDMRRELQAKLGEQYENEDWAVDVVLAADVGYDLSLHEPLSVTINSLLQRRGKKCNDNISTTTTDRPSPNLNPFNLSPNPLPSEGIALLVEEIRWRDIFQWYTETLFHPLPAVSTPAYEKDSDDGGDDDDGDGYLKTSGSSSSSCSGSGRGGNEPNLKLTLLHQEILHTYNKDNDKGEDDRKNPSNNGNGSNNSSSNNINSSSNSNNSNSDQKKQTNTNRNDANESACAPSLATSRASINLLICGMTAM